MTLPSEHRKTRELDSDADAAAIARGDYARTPFGPTAHAYEDDPAYPGWCVCGHAPHAIYHVKRITRRPSFWRRLWRFLNADLVRERRSWRDTE